MDFFTDCLYLAVRFQLIPSIFQSGKNTMNTYILMTKLAPDVLRQMKERAKLGRTWLEQVEDI